MILSVGSGFTSGQLPAGRARPGNSAGANFRLATGTAASEVSGQPAADQIAAATPASLAGLLALQEFTAGDQQRQALRHGQALLRELSRLQQAILGGDGDDAALAELALLAATPIETADPRLRALIGSVLLRVRIELAKRGR